MFKWKDNVVSRQMADLDNSYLAQMTEGANVQRTLTNCQGRTLSKNTQSAKRF